MTISHAVTKVRSLIAGTLGSMILSGRLCPFGESLGTNSHLGMRVCGDLTYRNPVAIVKRTTAPELFALKEPGPSLTQL